MDRVKLTKEMEQALIADAERMFEAAVTYAFKNEDSAKYLVGEERAKAFAKLMMDFLADRLKEEMEADAGGPQIHNGPVL